MSTKTSASSKKGFTLIELLVVVSIIGLLSSIILASFQTTQNKAKNTRVKSDLHQLQLALELYRASNTSYPLSAGALPTPLNPLVPAQIKKLPVPPQTGFTYWYSGGINGYVLVGPIFPFTTPYYCAIIVGEDAAGWYDGGYVRC